MDKPIRVTQDELEIATDAYLTAKDHGSTAEEAIKAGIEAVNNKRNRTVPAREAVEQIDRMTDAINTIRVIHSKSRHGNFCNNCLMTYPCDTTKVVNPQKEIM